MMKLLVVLLSALAGTVVAFSPSITKTSRRPTSALFVSSETFYRAVQCAEGDANCDIEELENLATELEEFVGCNFEKDNQDLCDKEMQDRIDVAEILRLQVELKLRTDYLKNANLFAEDVKQEHDAEERRKFKESLQFQRKETAGADLGLW